MSMDNYPAPEPCSAVYCQDSQKYIRELEAALHKAMACPYPATIVEVNDADLKFRPSPDRVPLCAIVTRFVMPAPSQEASS